jgi:hypothetical protein
MHRMTLVLAAVLIGALALLPCDVSGQQKNQKKQQQKSVPATDQDYYMVLNTDKQALTGQILSFDDATKTVSVRADFPEWVPNPKYRSNTGAQHNLVNDYNRLMQDQAKLATSRNPAQAQQHYMAMQNLQNRIAADIQRTASGNGVPPFISIDHLKDFDLTMQDKVVYRKKDLGTEYDDTGNIKKYTSDELSKLRGDNNPKGTYSAAASEFHPGQGVWVYLSPPKKVSSSASSSSSSSTKDKGQDEVKDTSVPRPTVKRLVIFKEGSVAPTTNDKGKKKKQ